MIKAIFFDWGYTFTKGFKNRDKVLDEILKPFGLTWQQFYPYWGQFYILRSLGKLKTDDEFELLVQNTLKKPIPLKKIIEIINESRLIPEEHIELVRKLKKDYKVGLLSNNVKKWIEQTLKNEGIEDLFDATIISSELGVRKPNALIYYEALRKLSAKPDGAVFISDEVADDLVGAAGLGMKTIWLKTEFKGWWRQDDEKVLKIYKPDAVINNLKEVISVIENLEKHESK